MSPHPLRDFPSSCVALLCPFLAFQALPWPETEFYLGLKFLHQQKQRNGNPDEFNNCASDSTSLFPPKCTQHNILKEYYFGQHIFWDVCTFNNTIKFLAVTFCFWLAVFLSSISFLWMPLVIALEATGSDLGGAERINQIMLVNCDECSLNHPKISHYLLSLVILKPWLTFFHGTQKDLKKNFHYSLWPRLWSSRKTLSEQIFCQATSFINLICLFATLR